MEQLSQSVSAGAATDTVFFSEVHSKNTCRPPTVLTSYFAVFICNWIMISVTLWPEVSPLKSWHAVGVRDTPKLAIEASSLVRRLLFECSYSSEKGKSGLVECIINKVVTQGDALSLLCDTTSVII